LHERQRAVGVHLASPGARHRKVVRARPARALADGGAVVRAFDVSVHQLRSARSHHRVGSHARHGVEAMSRRRAPRSESPRLAQRGFSVMACALALAFGPAVTAFAGDDDLGGLDDDEQQKQTQPAPDTDNAAADAAAAPAPKAEAAADSGPSVAIRPYA